MSGVEPMSVAAQVMPAINAVEGRCTDAVMTIIAEKRSPIMCTEAEWGIQANAFDDRDAFYAAMMPDEQDAIRVMHAAFERLRKLGWREAIYCPKDGSTFDAIEPGSTGIHSTAYEGEWPTGNWWVDGEYPSRPCLYRPTEAETRKRAEAAARFAAHAQISDQEQPS